MILDSGLLFWGHPVVENAKGYKSCVYIFRSWCQKVQLAQPIHRVARGFSLDPSSRACRCSRFHEWPPRRNVLNTVIMLTPGQPVEVGCMDRGFWWVRSLQQGVTWSHYSWIILRPDRLRHRYWRTQSRLEGTASSHWIFRIFLFVCLHKMLYKLCSYILIKSYILYRKTLKIVH